MIDPQALTAILADVAAGEATYKVLAAYGVPRKEFYALVGADETVRNNYARAKADGLERMADETQDIADDKDIDPHHKRIMVDTRKWLLSKLAPKKYGDKLEVAGNAESPLTLVISKSDAKL